MKARSIISEITRAPTHPASPQTTAPRVCWRGHGVEVLAARLDVAPAILPTLLELLDQGERDRAARFAFERDRHRFIVCRARLRQLLSRRLRAAPEAVEFGYGSRGKPTLGPSHASSRLRFNVSHSDDLAVFALVDGCEVGVDVEAVRVMPDADDIAVRFFSHGESAAYLALDPRDRPAGFCNCWTRKEAFMKALGDGLYHELDRFEVSLVPGQPARILHVEGVPGDECGWCIHAFTPAPGFAAAVVVSHTERTDTEHHACADRRG